MYSMWCEGVVTIAGNDPLVQDGLPVHQAPECQQTTNRSSHRPSQRPFQGDADQYMLAKVKAIETDPAHQNLERGQKLYGLLKDTAKKYKAACSLPPISNS